VGTFWSAAGVVAAVRVGIHAAIVSAKIEKIKNVCAANKIVCSRPWNKHTLTLWVSVIIFACASTI